MSRTLLSLAGFQVILTGRFWVIAEETVSARQFGNSANSGSKAWANDILDVGDFGVDCTFARDSAAALNTITAAAATNGAAITFPPNCHVKLTSTWLVKNLSGFTIKGISGAGNNGYYATNVPTITWTGAVGGTMIEMEYVDEFEATNPSIDGGGLATVGINVDKTGGGGTVNTTDGIFRRLSCGCCPSAERSALPGTTRKAHGISQHLQQFQPAMQNLLRSLTHYWE